MTEHSVFSKKHAAVMARDKQALLEELNLPPALIDFVRTNAKALKIGVAVIVIVLISWEGYGKYTSVQRDRSADLLYQAMQIDATGEQAKLLKELSNKYGNNGSGLWGTIELGHQAFKDGKFQEAVTLYESVLDSISANSPLFPLLQYNLALAYENLPDTTKAKAAYLALSKVKGFAGEADLGLARIAETEGNKDDALAKYQDYVDLPETQDGPTKEWAKNKIQLLTPKKGK